MEYYQKKANLTEYDWELHEKIVWKKEHQEAVKSRSRMHLVNNLKKSHIEFEKNSKSRIEEEKEHLATSWIEDEDPT